MTELLRLDRLQIVGDFSFYDQDDGSGSISVTLAQEPVRLQGTGTLQVEASIAIYYEDDLQRDALVRTLGTPGEFTIAELGRSGPVKGEIRLIHENGPYHIIRRATPARDRSTDAG